MKRITLAAVISAAIALAACGDRESGSDQAATSAPPPAASPAPEAVPATDPAAAAATATAGATATPVAGAQTYNRACSMCHASGVAGAPRTGDAADWQTRSAQGKDVLYQHAIQGYTGPKGVMPPKGGFTSLSDEEVRSAVDYMLAQSS